MFKAINLFFCHSIIITDYSLAQLLNEDQACPVNMPGFTLKQGYAKLSIPSLD